jgi:membrane-bound inhibitor of C-type lysozyme
VALPQTMSGSGARYANAGETFVFWNKGDTAFITEGKAGTETYSGCVAAE